MIKLPPEKLSQRQTMVLPRISPPSKSSASGLTTQRDKTATREPVTATNYGSTGRAPPSPLLSTVSDVMSRRENAASRGSVAATDLEPANSMRNSCHRCRNSRDHGSRRAHPIGTHFRTSPQPVSPATTTGVLLSSANDFVQQPTHNNTDRRARHVTNNTGVVRVRLRPKLRRWVPNAFRLPVSRRVSHTPCNTCLHRASGTC